MAGWHHGLDGHESERTPGDVDEQGGLACCDSWGYKESDTTERLCVGLWLCVSLWLCWVSLLHGLFSSYGEWGLLSSYAHRLPNAVSPLVAEHRL